MTSSELPVWTFGEPLLDEQVPVAVLLRRLSSLVLSLEAPGAELAEVTELLTTAVSRLEAVAPEDSRPRVGALADGPGRVYLDHGRDVGAYNPMFPIYDIHADSDLRATGTVNFPVCYEGPPGYVHGGFLGVFFDCIVQHHNCVRGLTGRTRGLELRYRRPVPLQQDLEFVIDRAVDATNVTSTAMLQLDGQALCIATTSAVASDHSALPPVSPRRAG
jgi:hypothetical protein